MLLALLVIYIIILLNGKFYVGVGAWEINQEPSDWLFYSRLVVYTSWLSVATLSYALFSFWKKEPPSWVAWCQIALSAVIVGLTAIYQDPFSQLLYGLIVAAWVFWAIATSYAMWLLRGN